MTTQKHIKEVKKILRRIWWRKTFPIFYMRTGKCGICHLTTHDDYTPFDDQLKDYYCHLHGYWPDYYWFHGGVHPRKFSGSTSRWYEPRIEFLRSLLKELE